MHNTTVARISPTGFYCASADVSGTGESGISMYQGFALAVLTWIELVKVWDTIGEDKTVKGEYKVLAGRMYAAIIVISCMEETTDRR